MKFSALVGAALISVALVGAALISVALVGAAHTKAVTVAEDIAVAEVYWGTQPLGCASREVIVSAEPPLEGHADADGYATKPVYGHNGVCEMWVRESLPLRIQCLIVVHEFGHWLGLDHSQDSTSIMYWTVNAGQHVGVCDEQWLSVRWTVCKAMSTSPPAPPLFCLRSPRTTRASVTIITHSAAQSRSTTSNP